MPTKHDDLAPCGHTEAQARWLGCVEKVCRADDLRKSIEFQKANGIEPKQGTQAA